MMDCIANNFIAELTRNGLYKPFLKASMTLTTDEERVKFILRNLLDQKILSLLPEPLTKSITASQDYREKGTQFFVTPSTASQLDTTIDLYTKSIVFAPPGSRELALGYANRSAALFTARLYQDCLQDISRALALPYPDDLKAKLYARRARCLMSLRSPTEDQKEEVKHALEMAAEYLDKMTLDSKGRKIVERMLGEPEKMIPAASEYIKWHGETLMPKVSEENPEIKGLSSALKLEYNREFGSHTVATRNISPGEVLAVMKPYAGLLFPEKRLTHCGYCMEQTWSSIPCEGCCVVVYCNENCKNRAYDEHHDVECQVTKHLAALEMASSALLSLRLAVKAIKETGSIQALRKKVKELEARKDPRTIGFTRGLPADKDYASIYSLVRNTELRSLSDLFGISMDSSYILIALATKSDFFGKRFDGMVNELAEDADVTFIGGLIMRHQQILFCNAHIFYEEGPQMDPIQRGIVLMPFSQMNHSCNPGVTKIAHGMNMVFYANHSTKEGEQIFDNYGESFGTESRQDRRMKLLDNYYFICNCIACTENWLTYDDLCLLSESRPLQPNPQLAIAMKNFAKYHELARNGGNLPNDVPVIIADINNMVKVIEKTVGLSAGEYVEILDTRKRILGLTGNRLQSVNLN